MLLSWRNKILKIELLFSKLLLNNPKEEEEIDQGQFNTNKQIQIKIEKNDGNEFDYNR